MAVNRDKILREAEKLVQKGKIEQAIREYEKLLKSNPNDANTINRVGDLYGRVGQVEKAVELYERIADNYTRDGFTTKAIAILKKINRLAPQRLDIFAKLAELYVQQGLIVEAKSQFQILADWFVKSGDSAKAIEIHRKLVQLDPDNHMAHLRLADLLMQKGEAEGALQVYDRLGRMLLQRDKLDEAERLYRHALEQNPPQGEFLEPLCIALLEGGRATAAREFLKEALRRSPKSSGLRLCDVRVRLAFGESAKAASMASALLQEHPDDQDAQALTGKALLAVGEGPRARDVLVPLCARLTDSGDIGGAQSILGDLVKAMPHDEQVLRLAVRAFAPSGDAEMVFTLKAALADSLVRKGQRDEARQLYVELLGVDSENRLFRQRLAQIDGEAEVAEVEAEPEPPPVTLPQPKPPVPAGVDAIDLELPDLAVGQRSGSVSTSVGGTAAGEKLFDPNERFAEASVFAKYGLVQKAVSHLEDIVHHFPDHVEAHEKLVLLRVEDGNPEAALPAARRLLEHYRLEGNSKATESLLKVLPQVEHYQPGEEMAPEAGEALEEGVIVVDIDTGSLESDGVAPAAAGSVSFDSAASEDDGADFTFELSSTSDDPIAVAAGAAAAEAAPASQDFDFVIDLDAEVGEAPDVDEPVQAVKTSFDAASTELDELERAVGRTANGFSGVADLPAADGEGFDVGEREAETEIIEPEIVEPESGAAEVAQEAAEPGFGAAGFDAGVIEHEQAIAPPVVAGETETSAEPEEELVEITESFVGPTLNELDQLDFFIQQELFEDAIRMLRELEAVHYDDEDLAVRRATLKSKGVLLEDVPVVSEGPEELFADEDEYFDLAKELEEELAEEEAMVEEATGRGRGEAQLEEVFREFQKGVAEQLSEEDSDTHFNLGIAYKEMGLLPEAIREFQIASRDAAFFVECCSMIGVCYVEQGMFPQAAEWYSKALASPGVEAEASVALRYDLAAALESGGEHGRAAEIYSEIAVSNPGFRDVSERLSSLVGERRAN